MARPNKIGLDYFPLDVDIFEDEKMSAISGEFGIKGEITVIKLLCAIYRNGYFILWNDLLKFKLLRNLPGVSSELIESIVNRLVLWEFFDKALFDSVKVLTSKGIQRRYFEAVKRRKTDDELPYMLINVCNNTFSNDINADKNTTKEIKGKEKEKKENIPPYNPPDGGGEDLEEFSKKQKELEAKEAELRAKEQELLKLDAALKAKKRAELPKIDFVSPEYAEVFTTWLEYKRERRESYKSDKSLRMAYSKLLQLSENDPFKANAIVQQSMANNWAGLFELKQTSNGKRTDTNQARRESRKILNGLAAEILAADAAKDGF